MHEQSCLPAPPCKEQGGKRGGAEAAVCSNCLFRLHTPAVPYPLLPFRLFAGEENAGTAGDPPVTSRHYAPPQLGRQRSRMWGTSHNEVDSLQAAMDDFQVRPPPRPARQLSLHRRQRLGCRRVGCPARVPDLPAGLLCWPGLCAGWPQLEVVGDPAVPPVGVQEEEEGGARVGSARRRMLRRNSVSMILENPVLAQARVQGVGWGGAPAARGASTVDCAGCSVLASQWSQLLSRAAGLGEQPTLPVMAARGERPTALRHAIALRLGEHIGAARSSSSRRRALHHPTL